MKFLRKIVSFIVSSSMLLHATPINFIVPSQITAGSFTISSPGTYLLVDDTTFSPAVSATAITISSNNVTLDLNGKYLIGGNNNANTGIDLPASRNDIIIKNGFITDFAGFGVRADVGTTYTVIMLEGLTVKNRNKTGIGISFANASDSVVRRCNCSGADTGASFSSCARFQILDSLFNNNITAGLSASSSKIFTITNCQANFNVSASAFGASLTTCDSIIFHNCFFNGNVPNSGGGGGAMGTSCKGLFFSKCEFCGNSNINNDFAVGLVLTSCSGCVIKECFFSENRSMDDFVSGVFLQDSHGNYFESCIAADNFATGGGMGTGFHLITTASNNIFNECKALRNRSATGDSRGFSLLNTCTANVFKNCEAYNNKGGGGGNIGFFDGNSGTGLGTNTYYGCVASQNTVNFSSSIATSIWSYGPGTFSPAVTNLPGTFYNVSIIA